MAGENDESVESENPKESDAAFMEVVREFPAIYNWPLKDFKDKNKNQTVGKPFHKSLTSQWTKLEEGTRAVGRSLESI